MRSEPLRGVTSDQRHYWAFRRSLRLILKVRGSNLPPQPNILIISYIYATRPKPKLLRALLCRLVSENHLLALLPRLNRSEILPCSARP